ncbi:MAG: hypothetical protein JNM59_07150 [Hyphomonadaceae bacterium]|nr:hypothetical protein [Hyphomonadaceae bacterium]
MKPRLNPARPHATAWRVSALALLGAISGGAEAQTPAPRFESEIAAFAGRQTDIAAHCPILFVGSSSIRLWGALNDDMAPASVLNRGFGGATIADINAHFDVLVTAARPWAIFFYAGENDIADGATPEAVVASFTAFLDRKDAALGATPVYFISLKPSIARAQQRAAQRAVNTRIRALARARRDLHYVDVASAMMANGTVRDIFVEDGLHMTPEGYDIWRRVIRPLVVRETARARAPCAPAEAR